MLLDQILFYVPCPIFWKNLDGAFLGCNKLFLAVAGFNDYIELIGKTDAELPWKKYKNEYAEDDHFVITTGKIITRIESIPLYDRIIISETTKSPLIQDGQIIGVLGICLDITDRKEVERLKIENEAHRTQLEEQSKFQKIANQVAHDIRSPLSSLLMIVKSCSEIPEEYRIALREAAISIGDIANNLLARYQTPQMEVLSQEESDHTQDILISAVLLEIFTEKKYQYQHQSVKFDYDFSQSSYFAFIKIQLNAFRRMISNLINNAVDAFEGKPGHVFLRLDADNEFLKIIVEDDGKGMPSSIIEKILKNIAVTSGKKHGHGIGLTQVRDTLNKHQGEMQIESTPGKGAKIILNFPRMSAPAWIAEEIRLKSDDIIVILDDDASIHVAWNTHFDSILRRYSEIQLKHFNLAEEALHFIKTVSQQNQKKLFLLTDFELLRQKLTGLDVVAQAQIERSILVTSHYANKEVLKQAAQTHTRILPKQLASEIPMIVDVNDILQHENISLVMVDDDPVFTKMLSDFVFIDFSVASYTNPEHFLKNVDQYAKDTRIYLDSNFQGSLVKGMDIAKILHEKGYIHLYLLSGERFDKSKIPDYLTVLLKGDIEALEASLND